MSGQRRANWRTEAAQMVGQLDARLLVRIEAAEELATRRFGTVGSVLDLHAARITKLERLATASAVALVLVSLAGILRAVSR